MDIQILLYLPLLLFIPGMIMFILSYKNDDGWLNRKAGYVLSIAEVLPIIITPNMIVKEVCAVLVLLRAIYTIKCDYENIKEGREKSLIKESEVKNEESI